MIAPSDPEYAATTRLLRGEARLAPPFDRLAAFVEETWGVRVVNVVYDRLKAPRPRPRLQIIVWDQDEETPFRDRLGYDPAVQALIADRFRSLLGWASRLRYDTTDLFVIASAFAPIARWDALRQVPEADLEARIRDTGLPGLWGVHALFDGVVVFVHTDAQVAAAEEWRDACVSTVLDIAAPFDPFGAFMPERVRLSFDSKETFDRDYSGSWFAYWR